MAKIELLAPVGDKVMLKAAIDAGCDSVYFGTKLFNMRAFAKNFELSELKNIVKQCHENNVKAYVTINSIIYENELGQLKITLKAIKEAGVDAVICWDMSVVKLCKEMNIEIHLSTQASVSNSVAAQYYKDLGINRIVLARECTLDHIKQIKNSVDVEIETFCHGARCISISGRCFLSHDLYGKSANRGECYQVCRRSFIVKDPETDKELEVNNKFVMSPKDLCTIEILPKLINAGVSVLKIEGRKRTPEYVKLVVESYRKALDFIETNHSSPSFNEDYAKLAKELKLQLKKVYNRGFSTGFYLGEPLDNDNTDVYGGSATQKKEYIGYVKNYFHKVGVAELKLESSGIEKGDSLMFQGPTTGVVHEKIDSMQINHKDVESAPKGRSVAVKVSKLVRPNDKVFKII